MIHLFMGQLDLFESCHGVILSRVSELSSVSVESVFSDVPTLPPANLLNGMAFIPPDCGRFLSPDRCPQLSWPNFMPTTDGIFSGGLIILTLPPLIRHDWIHSLFAFSVKQSEQVHGMYILSPGI
jgi:hypothetical protein